MCRPIQGNSVRPKFDLPVIPLKGSSQPLVDANRHIVLSKDVAGLAEGPHETDPDFFFIIFPHGANQVVRACLHHTNIKGVEPRP